MSALSDKEIFESFFSGFAAQAYELSLSDRKQMDSPDLSLTFGQMQVGSLAQILELIQPSLDDCLIDLGSGIGKLVIGANYLYPYLAVTGVEILPSLHQLAQEILIQFYRQLAPDKRGSISLICGDMFAIDLAEYSLVFVNSTCMDDAMLEKTARHLATHLRPLAKVVSLGRVLRSPLLKLWKAGAWRMGWQIEGEKTPVFIYQFERAVNRPSH